jgi:hypothetical protein
MRIRTGYTQKLKSERTGNEKSEIAQWVALRLVTPEDWLQRVLSLPERLQGPSARMIWWDFWSDKVVAERWRQFDRWLTFDHSEENNPVPTTELAECLKLVGYPPYRIRMRLMAF